MRKRFLIWLSNGISSRPGTFLLATLSVTVIFGWFASNLTIDSSFTNLMPSNDPMVQEFERVHEDFSGSASMIVVAEGNPELLIEFAEKSAPEIEKLTHFVDKVDYQLPRDLIIDHALMLMKTEDLQNNRALFENPNLVQFLRNLNDTFEKEYTGSGGGSIEGQEEEAIRFMDGIQTFIEELDKSIVSGDPSHGALASQAILLGDTYYRSWDRRMLIMTVIPTFHFLDMEADTAATYAVEKVIKRIASETGVTAGLTGIVPLSRDEMVAITNDSYTITIIALVLILALFIIAFRMVLSPIFAIITLVVGIIWALGLAEIIVGSLNIMTSMMGVILVGLGIDFSIHIISVYTEQRGRRIPPPEALQKTLITSGNGILTGGMTTSAAFFTFLISTTAGMREFGWGLGAGILLTMLAAITFLPAVLVLQDRVKDSLNRKKTQRPIRDLRYNSLGKTAATLARFPGVTIIFFLVLLVLVGWRGLNITWDYNYLNMEPEGLETIILQDRLLEKMDISGDYAFVTAETLEEAYEYTRKAEDMRTSGTVRSITDFLPPQDEQEQRSRIVSGIREKLLKTPVAESMDEKSLSELTTELERLEMNIIEIQDMANLGGQRNVYKKTGLMVGIIPEDKDEIIMNWQASLAQIMPDPETGILSRLIEKVYMVEDPEFRENVENFQRGFSQSFRDLALKMANPESVTLETIPATIRDQYVGKASGLYLIMVYPNSNVWDLEFLPLFTNELMEISPRATGLPPVFLRLMELFGEEGIKATALALVIIFLVLLIDFRSPKKALLAIMPLSAGALWMLGVMEMTGLQLTMVNIMAIPLIIGIGVDDGIHVIHRYDIEGFHQHTTVFSSTGRAIFLTSLTTMLGFGSLTFATYRGLGSMGNAMFIGVGTCFLATVIALPALSEKLFGKK